MADCKWAGWFEGVTKGDALWQDYADRLLAASDGSAVVHNCAMSVPVQLVLLFPDGGCA
jgi:hypothetical protein